MRHGRSPPRPACGAWPSAPSTSSSTWARATTKATACSPFAMQWCWSRPGGHRAAAGQRQHRHRCARRKSAGTGASRRPPGLRRQAVHPSAPGGALQCSVLAQRCQARLGSPRCWRPPARGSAAVAGRRQDGRPADPAGRAAVAGRRSFHLNRRPTVSRRASKTARRVSVAPRAQLHPALIRAGHHANAASIRLPVSPQRHPRDECRPSSYRRGQPVRRRRAQRRRRPMVKALFELRSAPGGVGLAHHPRAPRGQDSMAASTGFDEAGVQAQGRPGRLLRWAPVHGNLYGTSRSGVEARLRTGEDVVLGSTGKARCRSRRLFPSRC